MASSQLKAVGSLARGLRVSRRAFTTTARQFEAVPAAAKTTSPAVADESKPVEITQAPNRLGVWSRSQKPRSQAMTGPRFEQTDFSVQPQPKAAIELIHKEPYISAAVDPHYDIIAPRAVKMPQQSHTISVSTTLLFTIFLFVAFFPGLFHSIWTIPAYILPFAKAPSEPVAPTTMTWFQKQFTLQAKSRGSYLVTDQVLQALPEIRSYKVGLLNLFIQHTSAALSLNENFDEDVRADMSDSLDRIVPEAGPRGEALYRHDAEGPDDMPAHVKSALIGASVTIPIKDGRLATGTWQGIYYLEFRADRQHRRIVATIQGEKA
uniref:Secondary thiamine-phosphate synthase enzyme n=2 Tax=Bionectria ochroleuca TaxID=29856 RepID=A0A0B7JRJ9_BIOOC